MSIPRYSSPTALAGDLQEGSPFRQFPAIASDPDERARFHAGHLRDDWAVQYPMIFDEHEYLTVCHQPGGHFHEWRGAVYLFETYGLLSLIESYRFKNNKWKRHVVQRLGAHELLAFFDSQKGLGFGSMQPPDLLVYLPDYSDYFFCEVKGPTDRLRAEQVAYFNAMAAVSGKEVVVLPYIR